MGGRRARPAARAHRRGRRVRRPGHRGIWRAEPQSPDSDGRGRGRGGLGIQRLRALPGGALRRRPAVAGGRAAARAGRHVDGLAGLDPVARHDRDILGPDPHARGRARPRGDRGGGQAPRRDLADPRPAPGHPPLRRRRHAHDRRHSGRRQLLSLLTGCRSSGRSCPTSRAGTRASSAASPFTSTSWCRSPEETSHALSTVRPDRPADLGAGVRRRLGRRHPDPPGARDQDRGDRARARRRHQLDRHGALLWRWRVGAGARLAARGRQGPALPVDQGAARSVPARRHRRSGQAQHRGEPEPAALQLGRAVAAAQSDRPADRRSADRRRPGAGRGRGRRCARAHA